MQGFLLSLDLEFWVKREPIKFVGLLTNIFSVFRFPWLVQQCNSLQVWPPCYRYLNKVVGKPPTADILLSLDDLVVYLSLKNAF